MEQILKANPNNKILACAPSNSAADLIAIKLEHLGPSILFRLNAISRSIKIEEGFPATLKRFSLINDNTVFAIPPAEELAKYRVIVSTCFSGGIPASLGLKRGYFSHIFIDEAGQGKEPEVMVPIKGIASRDTNVVLAGDNRQLGPRVHSGTAQWLGLKKSYLARLMEMDVYNIEGNNKGPGGRGVTYVVPNFFVLTLVLICVYRIVKLVKNFRSHPSILQFPNERFYTSELQSCGDPMITHSLENAEDLPKRGFPTIFHGVVGKDDREKSSPSFFNVDEVALVKKYCESLVSNRKNNIRSCFFKLVQLVEDVLTCVVFVGAEHIGIITPYHAQMCKIKNVLRRNPKLAGATVGSVEQFQGQVSPLS
jgi:helicase MOV-10